MKSFLKSLVFFSGSIFLSAQSPSNDLSYRNISIKHVERGGVGYDTGYTTVQGLFLTNAFSWKTLPLVDARVHVFDDGKWAANGGIGVRTVWKDRIYGVNAFYDYRTTNHRAYNQIGVGFETLGSFVDAKINGYFPVGKKISSPYDVYFDSFSGHSMVLSEKREFTMKGADAEVGFHAGKCSSWSFYGAAGPYYYRGPIGENAWGGKVRLNASYKQYITLGVIESYDNVFHNRVQGLISFSIPLGRTSKGKTWRKDGELTCRMAQPIGRSEIIVADRKRQKAEAINPVTGLPYYFVFVDNTSHSNGTYESPYHSLVQAQDDSSPNDIIYVFPGDGTTTGMDSGIYLKPNQKLWGSGIGHAIQTSVGTVSIPAQSTSWPTMTNTNADTDGNAITLSTDNAISGLIISSAIYDGIYGANPRSLEVSSCRFTNNTLRFAIEAAFSGDASVSITNNQFLDNLNGVSLTLNGTSNVTFLDNTFTGQTSPSDPPIEISATSNTFVARIENNLFDSNAIGSINFGLDSVVSATINVLNNTLTNNGTGSRLSLGSNLVIILTGTTEDCSLTVSGNTFSGNGAHAIYLPTDGVFTTFEGTITDNTMSNNGGSGFAFATPVDHLTLAMSDNTITGGSDNGIAIISPGKTSTGTVTISNNTITDVGNNSNGIAVNQDFSHLSLAILNNEITRCEGTGILSYASTGIDSLELNVSGNAISDCANGASGLDIEQYTTLTGSITHNTFADTTVVISSTLTAPTTCLTLTGNNSSADYFLFNPLDGVFNLSPCDVEALNTGVISTAGTVDLVQSCSDPTPCSP